MKVRVINRMQQYEYYEEFASKYAKGYFWFDDGYKIKDDDVLELIEYAPHKEFKDEIIAVCKDESNRIILIGVNGVKEIKEEEKIMEQKIKVGDICETVSGWGIDFQEIGTKVEVLDILEDYSDKTFARIKRVDNSIIGVCYLTSIKHINKVLLPVGTRVMVVKDILSAKKFTGKEFVIEESNEHFAVAKKYFESYDFVLAVNPFHLENGYVVVLEDEKKVEKWSGWKYDGSRHFYYRVKGNRIQAKNLFHRVQSKCLPQDTFDLEKGLDICKAKLTLKEYQYELERLIK